MQTKTDHSYGIVLIRKQGDTYEILLVEQYDKYGGTFWAFPKGHAEAGEAPVTAALRECNEEVGLSAVEIDGERTFDQVYSFVWNGILIEKTVTYFIGYVTEEAPIRVQPHEIASASWHTETTALQQLTHENSKLLLKNVMSYIHTKS